MVAMSDEKPAVPPLADLPQAPGAFPLDPEGQSVPVIPDRQYHVSVRLSGADLALLVGLVALVVFVVTTAAVRIGN